ncbi:MAG: YgjV family protein [Candidatus Nomurabacteria bacterium]|nr:MAG: YgjV family protein [Candidatus Nomurabacteria bacterium]
MLDNQLLIQGLGFFGLLFQLFSFQANDRSKILFRQGIGAIFFAVHFFLIGAFSGATISAVIAARNAVFYEKTKESWANHKIWMFFFMILLVALTLFFAWEGWFSLLPLCGTVVGTYARWNDKSNLIREFSLGGVTLWLIYSIIVGSIPAIINNALLLASVFVGFLRFDKHIDFHKLMHHG